MLQLRCGEVKQRIFHFVYFFQRFLIISMHADSRNAPTKLIKNVSNSFSDKFPARMPYDSKELGIIIY